MSSSLTHLVTRLLIIFVFQIVQELLVLQLQDNVWDVVSYLLPHNLHQTDYGLFERYRYTTNHSIGRCTAQDFEACNHFFQNCHVALHSISSRLNSISLSFPRTDFFKDANRLLVSSILPDKNCTALVSGLISPGKFYENP